MKSPLEIPIPEDPIQRVYAFGRDLAWSVLLRHSDGNFTVLNGHIVSSEKSSHDFYVQVMDKWKEKQPELTLLHSFGVLDGKYLSQKAFDLLSAPLSAPQVFISYKRSESSAFALLLEARLRIAGNQNVFIDKNIRGGEEWHGVLQEKVQSCQYFICLVGKETLQSEPVQREIAWAQEAKATLITVCHNGARLDDCPPELTRLQGHEVLREGAENYEAAVNFVLNSLGYPTY